MNDLQVVIDAGHGGEDLGAVANGVNEKDLNLMISQYMYEQFRNKGIPVTLIRQTDETITPNERVRRILAAYGNNPNVVVISNHLNAGGGDGAEVIYALRNDDLLARNILQALENAGQNIRTYYQRRLPSDTSKDYYFIHRDTGITKPVIVEYGFIDNPTDLTRIQNNYRKYVDAVVDAVIDTEKGTLVLPVEPAEGVYVVQSGDSLWKIANLYNTTVDNIKTLNNLTSNTLSIGQVLRIPTVIEPTGNTYTVKSGDSLWRIANLYNTTVDNIKSLNNLTSNSLTIGQVLRVPPLTTGMTYVVKSGDSLWKIANLYNTTVDNLKSLNNLTGNSLSIGQTLQIP